MRALALLFAPFAALAHDGHGAPGAHLHPGEVIGLVALAAVVLVALARFWRK